MGRIGRTFELAKRSWAVLQADRELLALPVMSAIATVIAAVTFLAPLISSGALAGDDGTAASGVGYAVMFLMYVVLAFITIFFNAALVHAANERLSGGDPTLGSALRGAWAHVGPIAIWSMISATVSMILRGIEQRAGIVGKIVGGLAGIAWSLTTFLVIPVLVIEGRGAVDSLKRSAQLFKQTWGEQVAGNFGFGIVGFIASLPGILLMVLAFGIGTGSVMIMLIALAVFWFILVAVVISALSGIFQAAVYRYAAAGPAGQAPQAQPYGQAVPPQWGSGSYFDPSTIQSAFRRR